MSELAFICGMYMLFRELTGIKIPFMEELLNKMGKTWVAKTAAKVAILIGVILMLLSEHPRKEWDEEREKEKKKKSNHTPETCV